MKSARGAQRAPANERRPAVSAAPAAHIARSATPSPARALQQRLGNKAAHALVTSSPAAAIQCKAAVSAPNDPAELEAHSMAAKVMRMAAPGAAAPLAGPAVQRSPAGGAAAAPASVQVNTSGGAPLSPAVRGFMEPRFGADFSKVRVHTDSSAAAQSEQLNAHAFAYGQHVFFGRNRYQPDTPAGKELIAHELTHTIQQGGAVQRSVDTAVTQRRSPAPQRLGFWDTVAGWANAIPGFRMFTIILGINPINMAAVDRGAANILRALVEFIPGGALIVSALEAHGIFERVATWGEQQVRAVGVGLGAIRQAMDAFLASLSGWDILNPGGAWERAKRIFTEPITRLINVGKTMVTGILGFIREAILLPLARLAEGTAGYDLLKAVLGEDPVTGQPVVRNPATLIGGFMKLIGQEEVWENIQKSNALPRAWAWFQGALAALMGMVRQIPGLFVAAFKSLQLADLLAVPTAFARIAGIFGGFLVQFLTWAGGAVFNLLEIIFEVVAPAAIPYLKKAGGAFKIILKNPVGFIRNLVAAVVGGIKAFVGNIWIHLKAGFVKWLFGALAEAGIAIPDGLPSLPAILKLVTNVLGLTLARLKIEATKMLGPTAVAIIEKLIEYVQVVFDGGPAALWAKIKEDLSNLKDMAIDAIQDWLVTTIVKQAVVKLVSLFNPVGAFIQAILAIYNTIQVVIERIGQIAAFAGAVINSIHAIATGAIGGAINWIEKALAGAVPVVLALLAGLAGVGGLAAKVKQTLEKAGDFVWGAIRKLVKKGIDAVKKLFAGKKGKDKPDERTPAQQQADLSKAIGEAEAAMAKKDADPDEIRKALPAIRTKYKLTKLDLVKGASDELHETDHVLAVINPTKPSKPQKFVKGMPLCPVDFDAKKYNVEEYRRQLNLAHRTIRAMKIAAWLANRTGFVERFEAEKAAKKTTPSGRDPRSGPAQEKFRANAQLGWEAKRQSEILKERGIAKPTVADFKSAEQAAKRQWKKQVALHPLDQVAGGDFEPTDMGDRKINSSIGSTWKNKVGDVEKVVKTVPVGKHAKTNMNVSITLNGTPV